MLLRFDDADCLAVARAGGKGASLARMSALGLPVPEGFVVPADALAAVVDADALRSALPDHAKAQAIVAGAPVPDEVGEAYAALGDDPPVAVRSSACAEDSETASYAGQQETYLHVRGADAVRDRVRDCWASFFSERAIFYRQKKGSLDDLGMAVVVQRMVRADVAGVLFTCDPVRGRRDRMVVEAVLGLGEAAVSGQVTPDHYILKRDGTVRKAQVARQPFAVVPVEGGGVEERELGDEGGEQKLGEEQLRALARLGDDLEQRLGGPQDIEWALEGGELYVLQARPVTT
ncbi:MAG TPA: PEP/pyruvate-binding domain-containing protein [Solirubrobacteraceae bacterium]|jgi:pyruvate, water dikinase